MGLLKLLWTTRILLHCCQFRIYAAILSQCSQSCIYWLLVSVQSIRPKGDTLLFSTDARCNAGVPQLLRDRVTYVMSLESRKWQTPILPFVVELVVQVEVVESVFKSFHYICVSRSVTPGTINESTNEWRLSVQMWVATWDEVPNTDDSIC